MQNLENKQSSNKIDKHNVEDILPLTSMQEGMLVSYVSNPKSYQYLEQLSVTLKGEMDLSLIEQAWQHLIESNEMLRTVFRWEKIEKPVQIVLKNYNIPIRYIQNMGVEEVKLEERLALIDLRTEPLKVALVPIDAQTHELIITHHHILCDGWSYGILFKELLETYSQLCEGKILKKKNKNKYKEYVNWQRNSNKEIQKQYWNNYLKGFDTISQLPHSNNNEESSKSKEVGKYIYSFQPELNEKVNKFTKEQKITLANLFYSVWGLVLQRYNNNDDVVFGTTISGRNVEISGVEEIVGMFINTLPLRIKTDEGQTVEQFLSNVEHMLLEREEYESTPLIDIRSYSELSNKESLFNSIVVIENYPLESRLTEQNQKLLIADYNIFEINNFDLTLQFVTFEKLELHISYNPELFTSQLIERLCSHYILLLSRIIENKNQKVTEVDMLSELEKQQILVDFNQTSASYPVEKMIHQIFEEQVSHKPDQIAVIYEHQCFTYQELNERANQLARLLRKKGVQADTIVGIMAERSFDMMVGVLGILKAGGAYLPIDPQYPTERITYMLENSQSHLLLTQKGLTCNFSFNGELIDLEDEKIYRENSGNLEPLSDSKSLAYVIYTSGSTGKPKGVMIEHRSVINRINWMQNRYPISEKDVILQKTPFSFDVSVWELFWWGFTGARVCFLIQGGEKDPAEIFRVIKEHNVTTIHFVPSMLNVFLDYVELNQVSSEISSLRQVFASGEALHIQQVERFNNLFKHKDDASLFNLYGPTEATVDVSYFDCPKDLKLKSIPIGKPVDNTSLYIINRYNQLQPVGVPGELCIAGDGLARGYLNRPDLTNEKFVENPFGHGKRMYKTGDLAKWNADGDIEYLGRIDHQVKIRGYRIELGEIESELLKHPTVKECVVIDRIDQNNHKYLYAYLVGDNEIDTGESRDFLKQQLPMFMIPTFFEKISKLPLSQNGKVDRKALPLKVNYIKDLDTYIPPRNELDCNLIDIWQEVLGVKGIGIDDNFYELGGHSITMMNILSKIEKKLSLEVPFKVFLENCSIRTLSDKLANNKLNTMEKMTYPEVQCNPGELYIPFPQTNIQMAYVVGRSDVFEMGGVSTHAYAEVETKLDIQRLNDALNKVINRHPMLRAIILENGKQKILENVPLYSIERVDLRHLDEEKREELLMKERKKMSHHVFVHDQWPLYEFKAFHITDSKSYLFIGFDPLIADAASLQILLRDWMDIYHNKIEQLPKLNFTFRDYMQAYDRFKKSEIYQRDKQFWLKQLEDFPSAPELPLKQKPAEVKNPHFKRLAKTFNRTEWNKFKKIAQEHQITPSALLLAIYGEVLAYWSNQSHLAVNVTVFNRYPFHKDIQHIIGDFTSTILTEFKLRESEHFWKRMETAQGTLFEALEHRHYDGVEFIREISQRKQLGTKALMPIVFTSALFNDGHDAMNKLGEMKTGITQTSQVYIDNTVLDENGELVVRWDYVEQLFEQETINCMFTQYIEIIENILSESEKDYVFKLSVRDQNLLQMYNKTKEDIPVTLLHQLFEEKAKRLPLQKALIFENESLTYQELEKRSNQVAHYLLEHGVGPNKLVGLLATRSISTIINVLGILKAGAAYVPVDPAYPKDRQEYILSNSQCLLLIKPELYQEQNLETYSTMPCEVDSDPSNIAYIIYTSGSTGKPKGVTMTHAAAANTILDINRKFNVNENDRVIGISSMCFDLSVYDIFGTFAAGATLVLVNDQRDVKNLYRTVKDKGITIWNSVPAIMDLMLNYTEERIEENEDKLQIKPSEVFYWSPAFQWKLVNGEITIDGKVYSGLGLDTFLQLYSFTQEGVKLNELAEKFLNEDQEKLDNFISRLVDEKILVNSILGPHEVFHPILKEFSNSYGDEIFTSMERFEKYKHDQLKRTVNSKHNQTINLENSVSYPDFISKRKSYREFSQKQISFSKFSKLLSVFKQFKEGDTIRYFYATAGGLYPIDVYVYVKKGRVEHVDEGLYYYDPVNNKLKLVSEDSISNEIHHYGNRKIFKESAFTTFFVYNAGVNMPKYGSSGYFYACLDTGIMIGTLTQNAELLQMGLCSIGEIFFDKIKDKFPLTSNHVLMHTIECGLKPGATEDKNLIIDIPKQTDVKKYTSLRLVMLSGDWISMKLPEDIQKTFPQADVISLGGATEAAIWSIYYPLNEQVPVDMKSIPYGRPLANQQFYVLNENMESCPIGVKGELYIGGAGLAQGYFNDPEKTTRSFINHHIFGSLYKTGDYGVLHREGFIEFLGRKDHQIKIRGYRIEIGEIENCLLKLPFIKKVIVVDNTDDNGMKYLCAYFVADKVLSISQVREAISKDLPDYMVPTYFVQVENIGLTPNGKIDRKSLPKPDVNMINVQEEYVEAGNKTEEILVDIWKEVLGLERVGIYDNFFEIGGNSVKLIEVFNKANKYFQEKIRVIDLFSYPQISSLVNYLEDNREVKLETAGKRNLQLKTLSMPKQYFNLEQPMEKWQSSTLKFALEDKVFGKIKEIIKQEDITSNDLFFSIFAHMLSDISEHDDVTIQTVNQDEKNITPVKVDLSNLNDFSDLFRRTKVARLLKGKAHYSVREVDKLFSIKKAHEVLVLFSERQVFESIEEIERIFDLALLVDENAEGVQFVYHYHANRLQEEKIEELVYGFVQAIHFIVNQYS